MLKHHSHALAELVYIAAFAVYKLAVQPYFAAVRRFQQSYDVQESCFSGSAFALDGDKLSGFNMQRVIPKQDFFPEAFIDIG